ncbi:MAG TPA: oligopeptide/dipeptide ABC transporter ATP-binding protein, partial [Anaerolineales bacterium]|nr:oligopeptide/dipeptide ABC transporter ATP-binding protein [Anaerolineales bacterium]
EVIPGTVPNLINLPSGCRFQPRCQACVKYNMTICAEKRPDLIQTAKGHKIRCWLYKDSPADGHVAPLKEKIQ